MNITWIQTLVLALIQGVTELFPISSLGHTVIIPGLLGWLSLVQSPQFLPVIVAFHLGTSIALVLYFWRDWWQVFSTLVKSVQQGQVRQGDASWVSWLVIIGCIPAGMLGVVLEKPLKHLFASPLIAALFLIVNGVLLLLGEHFRRRTGTGEQTKQENRRRLSLVASRQFVPAKQLAPPLSSSVRSNHMDVAAIDTLPLPLARADKALRPLTSLTWKDALLIGLAQSLALLPGISRSGATMAAGLGVGLSHEDAAHYAFLLGTPLIAAAALLEIPQLIGVAGATIVLIIVGMVLSGLAAYLSTAFLMRYFETGRLHPFAYYCFSLGGISLVLFLLGVGAH
jgi:undecaprenyl-diphosphatase